MARSISVIIPSRNELYLCKTVQCLFDTASTDIEVFVLLDGWDTEPTSKNDANKIALMKEQINTIYKMADKNRRIRIMHKDKPVGQRIFMNEAAKLMRAPYMFKLDAHCITFPGWDTQLLEVGSPKDFVVTAMRNINEEKWSVGIRKFNFCYIDEHLRSRWWTGYDKRIESEKKLVESMSFYGTTWFCHRDFWNKHGGYWNNGYGWGDSGTEWALKTWLCGDRLLLHRGIEVGHVYRERFPYSIQHRPRVEVAREIRGAFYRNEYPLQVHPIEWLLGRFWPVPTWSKTLVTKEHREQRFFKK